jgi:hypothetical protein
LTDTLANDLLSQAAEATLDATSDLLAEKELANWERENPLFAVLQISQNPSGCWLCKSKRHGKSR